MSRKLAGFVSVHAEDGLSHSFGPADDVPAWAAKLITNPAAWAEGSAPDATPDAPTAAEKKAAKAAAKKAAADEKPDAAAGEKDPAAGESTGDGDGDTITIPPKGGAGSALEQWKAYALAKGFEVAPDATRDEIIEALGVEGIPTE